MKFLSKTLKCWFCNDTLVDLWCAMNMLFMNNELLEQFHPPKT